MGLTYWCRGWLACTALQHLTMKQVAFNPNSLQKAFGITSSVPRPYATLFIVSCLQSVALKATLMYSFDNKSLHFLHALLNTLHAIYFLTEMCYFGFFTISIASIVQVVFAVISVILSLTVNVRAPMANLPEESMRRPKRFTDVRNLKKMH
jgi:hypothetical protein